MSSKSISYMLFVKLNDSRTASRQYQICVLMLPIFSVKIYKKYVFKRRNHELIKLRKTGDYEKAKNWAWNWTEDTLLFHCFFVTVILKHSGMNQLSKNCGIHLLEEPNLRPFSMKIKIPITNHFTWILGWEREEH